MCLRCYFLRTIFSIRDTVQIRSLIAIVRVMILSRLDRCNLLYYWLPADSTQKLQRIINTACLIFRLSRGLPTANFIKQFYWLPMKQRVHYKFLLFGYRLVQHLWKIPVYLGALGFRNNTVTRCHYADNLKVPNVRTELGKDHQVLLFLLNEISCLLKWNQWVC